MSTARCRAAGARGLEKASPVRLLRLRKRSGFSISHDRSSVRECSPRYGALTSRSENKAYVRGAAKELQKDLERIAVSASIKG